MRTNSVSCTASAESSYAVLGEMSLASRIHTQYTPPPIITVDGVIVVVSSDCNVQAYGPIMAPSSNAPGADVAALAHASPLFSANLGAVFGNGGTQGVLCSEPVHSAASSLLAVVACQTQIHERCFLVAFEVTRSGRGDNWGYSPLDLGLMTPLAFDEAPIGLMLIDDFIMIPAGSAIAGDAFPGAVFVNLTDGSILHVPLGNGAVGGGSAYAQFLPESGTGSVVKLIIFTASYEAANGGPFFVAFSPLIKDVYWKSAAIVSASYLQSVSGDWL